MTRHVALGLTAGGYREIKRLLGSSSFSPGARGRGRRYKRFTLVLSGLALEAVHAIVVIKIAEYEITLNFYLHVYPCWDEKMR